MCGEVCGVMHICASEEVLCTCVLQRADRLCEASTLYDRRNVDLFVPS